MLWQKKSWTRSTFEDDLSSDKYSQVSENIAKELRKADKERGPKAPGVTE